MAVIELKAKCFSKAEENIRQAMLINPHSAIVHNLYGIFEELQMNDDVACRHYRAAYALDPTYQPATQNLERITAFDPCRRDKRNIDYGDHL